MRIAIIGAGIIGVTSAYELSADGHSVTVLERCNSVAAETSFANAGLVAPGYVTPWAAPGMPGKVVRGLFGRHSPVRFGGPPNLATLQWGWRWWRACSAPVHLANRLRMQRLAYFSRDRLQHLSSQLDLDYERAQGYLVLLRSAKELSLARLGLATLAALGTRHEILDAAGCRAVEPGLNAATPLHAGIYLPDDEVGNCRQFAHLLRREAERLGASFRFDTTVQRIIPGAPPRLQLAKAGADESYDLILVCAALGAGALLRPLDVRVPLQAVHGYSLTAPLRVDERQAPLGPRSALMDERYKIAISRLGNRVRISGSAEIGGVPERHNPRALATLHKVLHDWFPGVAPLGQAQRWKGARPMLPDGPPVLGQSGVDGVWLNLGHGSSGWALACGSARLLADRLAGRPAAIDTDGLGIERLRA